jgi:hypothetical protein
MDTFLPVNGTLKRSQTLTIATNHGSKFDTLALNHRPAKISHTNYPPPTNLSDENSGSLSSSSSTSSSISSNSSSPSMIYATNKLISSATAATPQHTAQNQTCVTNTSMSHSNSFTLSRNASLLQRRGSMGMGGGSTTFSNYKRKENEISSILYNAEFSNLSKPTPPSRTSSLRYKVHEPPRPVSSVYNNANANSNILA